MGRGGWIGVKASRMRNEDDSDPYYTSLCSAKTLQSNQKGFFQDYADQVTEAVGSKWIERMFGKLSTDSDRIAACYADGKVRMAVLEPLKHTQEMYRRKSAPVAFQKRMEADRALSSNNPQKALMLYSQSCMRAPGTDLYRDQLSSNNPPGTGESSNTSKICTMISCPPTILLVQLSSNNPPGTGESGNTSKICTRDQLSSNNPPGTGESSNTSKSCTVISCPPTILLVQGLSSNNPPGTGESGNTSKICTHEQLSSNNPPGTGESGNTSKICTVISCPPTILLLKLVLYSSGTVPVVLRQHQLADNLIPMGLRVDKTVDQGLSLALALGGRSEALLVLEDYLQSLADTNLAVKEGFPQHLRYQLYWRMGRCYRGLNQVAKARVSLQLSARLVREHLAQLGNEAVISLMRLQEELADLVLLEEEGSSNELLQMKQPDETPLPPVVAGCHPELGCASRLLGVSRTEQAGRYVVAREPVATGDTLAVEPAYAACLLPDKFGSHCHHCFARLNAPVACPECSGLAFCSVRCRDEACRSYHRYECHYMDLLIGSGMSILCHVALRMVTQAGEQFFLDRRQDLTSHSKEILPPSDKYLAVHNLVTHANKRKPKEFFQRTLMAVFLLKCLQKAGYFSAPSIDQTCLSEEELLIGSLLLRHLQLLQFNAHEVYETRIEAPRQLRTSKTEYIGVAIYPTVALFNHDCYPAVTRQGLQRKAIYFVGHSIVVRATRPLGSGDIVAENYGPVFTKRSLESRQRALTSRYWFRCICQACKENWPALDMVDNNDFRLWSYFTSAIEGFPLIFLQNTARATFSTSGFGSRATSSTPLD
uniref:SET and MYND domain-containing protein 4 n=1 Tax=Timema monikensis TaxID=170555 RepID=A0A7R9HJM5_9NEOP|nr:unnamed protein product [Timema monikensis]